MGSNDSVFPFVVLTTASLIGYARKLDLAVAPTLAKVLAGTVFVYYFIWRGFLFPLYFSELRHVPTVPGFPLWGQFFDIILNECGVPQREWHKQYGPIIRYFFPFGAERLSVADDEAIKHMTVKNPYNYPKPVRAKLWMVRILGEGVLLAEYEDHVYQRKTLTPGFSISAIRTFQPIFWEKCLAMTSLMRQEMELTGESTRSFEILEWLNRCTLDIIGKAGFGYEIHSLENPRELIREAYRLVFNFDLASRALHGIQAFFPSSRYIPARMNRDMEKARKIILAKATEILELKLDGAEKVQHSKDVLCLIARENKRLKELGEPGLSFGTMRDQVMTFLGAGHDTTATGAAWAIHLLATYPDVQNRVREEIRECFPFLFDPAQRFDQEKLEAADPDRLPYLDNVCRECLRFIPPIPMTVRESVKDDYLAGYKVPGGTVVYLLANSINRMPWFWGEDADAFNPDRWNNLPKTAVPSAFMTFLQGPRGCLGRKFAEVEMKVLLVALLSMFEFRRDYSVDNPERWKMWRLVLRPKEGVTVQATPIFTLY
ncbi:cytochrome P450 [Achaetomium macrosporum]|uniref:Cytochrome P450 n=1 Tax=Achaetomium macrosporum TaxID=79813 RepID=A0AAN7CFE2_9PEZI|nr:cytochrome P450 [Achaetomium macrosporum]